MIRAIAWIVAAMAVMFLIWGVPMAMNGWHRRTFDEITCAQILVSFPTVNACLRRAMR